MWEGVLCISWPRTAEERITPIFEATAAPECLSLTDESLKHNSCCGVVVLETFCMSISVKYSIFILRIDA